MGTTYSITIKNALNDKQLIKEKIDSLLVDFNDTFSTYNVNSELSKINLSNKNNIYVSDDIAFLLNHALLYSRLSNGSYDVTIGSLIKLWNFENFSIKKIPSKKTISNTLKHVGYNMISIENNLLQKKDSILIDLNSIAKGYAVDKIYYYLKTLNFDNFLVEIGGELRGSGESWLVGIQHPMQNDIAKTINLKNKAIATSGTYNNNFEYNNNIYAHIINPKTGFPYKYSNISATVIAIDCFKADALATMALTMNYDNFIEVINEIENVESYIIEIVDDNIIEYKSEGFDNLIIE